jgi:hypothetical protein
MGRPSVGHLYVHHQDYSTWCTDRNRVRTDNAKRMRSVIPARSVPRARLGRYPRCRVQPYSFITPSISHQTKQSYQLNAFRCFDSSYLAANRLQQTTDMVGTGYLVATSLGSLFTMPPALAVYSVTDGPGWERSLL